MHIHACARASTHTHIICTRTHAHADTCLYAHTHTHRSMCGRALGSQKTEASEGVEDSYIYIYIYDIALGSRKTETRVEKILRVVVTVARMSGENSVMV
jgi:hypothetical protein